MPIQSLLIRHALTLGLGVILINSLEYLKDMEALVREVWRHLDKTSASVRQAVAHDGLEFFRHVACQSIAHLDRPTQF